MSDLLSYDNAVALKDIAHEAHHESKLMIDLTVGNHIKVYRRNAKSFVGEEHERRCFRQSSDDYRSHLSTPYHSCSGFSILYLLCWTLHWRYLRVSSQHNSCRYLRKAKCGYRKGPGSLLQSLSHWLSLQLRPGGFGHVGIQSEFWKLCGRFAFRSFVTKTQSHCSSVSGYQKQLMPNLP